jgi:hypothetical protein
MPEDILLILLIFITWRALNYRHCNAQRKIDECVCWREKDVAMWMGCTTQIRTFLCVACAHCLSLCPRCQQSSCSGNMSGRRFIFISGSTIRSSCKVLLPGIVIFYSRIHDVILIGDVISLLIWYRTSPQCIAHPNLTCALRRYPPVRISGSRRQFTTIHRAVAQKNLATVHSTDSLSLFFAGTYPPCTQCTTTPLHVPYDS